MTRRPFKAADFGQDEELWFGSSGRPMFQPVEINWSRPKILARHEKIVVDDEDEIYKHGYLYAVVRNHWSQKDKDRIVYVGITNNLQLRFHNHPTIDMIKSKAGETSISLGRITTPGRRLNPEQSKLLREELEHILIWVLWDHLWNDKKLLCVPGQGQNGGQAWDVKNVGFKFSGRMPGRIVFPWAAVVPRRNNSRK
jgi:hypothetical protein